MRNKPFLFLRVQGETIIYLQQQLLNASRQYVPSYQ